MADLYLQYKYVGLIRPMLEGFSVKGDYLWNFRCPYCGDSKKSQSKRRGYIFKQEQNLFYKCHNCNTSKSFRRFVKENSPPLYDEMRKEIIVEKIKPSKKIAPNFLKHKAPKFAGKTVELSTVADLEGDHEAVLYCKQRMIPEEKFVDILYCNNLYQYSNSLKLEKKLPNDARIVFPFYSKSKALMGFQARLIKGSGVRYYTLKLKESYPKIFGLDRLDMDRDYYIVEGPIDSLFLDNSVAMMGASLGVDKFLPNQFSKGIYVYDNEPRNKQIVNTMERLIGGGYRVCIWPEHIKQKDINDMVLAGVRDIQKIISLNTYTGLKAKLKFTEWRRV